MARARATHNEISAELRAYASSPPNRTGSASPADGATPGRTGPTRGAGRGGGSSGHEPAKEVVAAASLAVGRAGPVKGNCLMISLSLLYNNSSG